jgi:hypothetical protein
MDGSLLRALFVCIALQIGISGCSGSTGDGPGGNTEGLIGAEGGSLTTIDGTATLVIPPNALSVATRVTLVSGRSPRLDARAVFGNSISIGPAGVTFAVPAQLTVRYDAAAAPSGIPEYELRLSTLASNEWVAIPTSTTDVQSHSALAAVNGGGTFIVRWSEPATPCTEPERHQFDFFIGTWVFSAGPNTPPGDEVIARSPSGCAILEFFSQGPYRGVSVSYYSLADQQWHQTYVDSENHRLVLQGTFTGGRMLLNSSPTERWGWEPLTPNQIRNFIEVTTDNGATWTTTTEASFTR